MFLQYIKLEWKRVGRLFPRICAVTVLVLFLSGLLIAGHNNTSSDTSAQVSRMNIGFVADENDSMFIELITYFLEHTDNIQEVCKFQEVTEAEGEEKLKNEDLDVLIIFPEDYIRSVYHGREDPITVKFGTAQSGISSLLFRQLSDAVSEYMMEGKAEIYAMQDMYSSWNLSYTKDSDELAKQFVLKILARKDMLAAKTVSVTDHMDTVTYYFSVAMVLLFLLWGLNCGGVLGKKEEMLQALLKQRGLSTIRQYLGKISALLLLFILNFLVIIIIGKTVVSFLDINTFMTSEQDTASFYSVKNLITWIDDFNLFSFLKILPALLFVCSLSVLVYELFHDGIGGTLFMFFAVLIMGFASGYFYPSSYFPVWVQHMGNYLPTGILLNYMKSCISGYGFSLAFLKIIAYILIFAVLYLLCTDTKLKIPKGDS